LEIDVPKRTCSVDGCDRPHKSKGLCSPHSQRLAKTGDLQSDLPIGTRKRVLGECAIDGCDRPLLCRGWCAAHYQRWTTYGDPLAGGTFRKPRRKRGKCSVPGCDWEFVTAGFCNRHYQRMRLNGTIDPLKPTCSLEGCDTRPWREGFCRMHWTRRDQFGDPRAMRECIINGCTRDAPPGKRGWCVMHYTRWAKHGDVGEAACRVWEPPHAASEAHQWCTTCHAELPLEDFNRDKTTVNGYARVCRDCGRDIRTAHFYGISAAAYRSLLEEQGGVCRICRKPETAAHQSGTLRRLAVDHDHGCCPGKKSCGRCVRGLLCARCNSAIGLFDEDRAVLLAAIEYLDSCQTAQVAAA
jgi:hypothetical protein